MISLFVVARRVLPPKQSPIKLGGCFAAPRRHSQRHLCEFRYSLSRDTDSIRPPHLSSQIGLTFFDYSCRATDARRQHLFDPRDDPQARGDFLLLLYAVLQTPRGFHYCLSQRAQHICQEISGATTSSRSIINTRDEPHADAERYRRLHVIVGDSNMSEVATYLKIGTTALVLDMIEDGFFDRDYSLQSPVQAIRDISHDPTLRETIKLK